MKQQEIREFIQRDGSNLKRPTLIMPKILMAKTVKPQEQRGEEECAEHQHAAAAKGN